MNNQFPHLPDGTNAMAVVVVDPTTGESLEGTDIKVGVISDSAAANVIAQTAIFGRLFPAA